MGRGMAGQLVAKGFDTTVFDLAEAPMEILRQKGAKRAVMLQVSAPFHCALMQPAAEAMAAAEATKPPAEPKKPGFLGRLLEKAQKPL